MTAAERIIRNARALDEDQSPAARQCRGENISPEYTRGENDGVWGTYANPTQSDDYDRGHAVGSAMRAVKVRAAMAAEASK